MGFSVPLYTLARGPVFGAKLSSPTKLEDNGQKGRGQQSGGGGEFGFFFLGGVMGERGGVNKGGGGRFDFSFLTRRPGCCTLVGPRHPIPRRQSRAVPQPLPGSVCVTTKRAHEPQNTTPHAVRAHRFGSVCRIPDRPYVVHFPERRRTKSQFLQRRGHSRRPKPTMRP